GPAPGQRRPERRHRRCPPPTLNLSFTGLDGTPTTVPGTGLTLDASGYGNGSIHLDDNAPIHAGTDSQVFSSDLGSYIHGANSEVTGGVYGYATPTADLNNLRAGNVVATYEGTATGTDYKERGFSMAVNFGNGSGTFTYNNTTGNSSAPSFEAGIKVNGATYQATSFTDLKPTGAPGVGAGSMLQGAFVGAKAGSTIGAMQINTANGTGTYGATFQGVRQP